MQPTARQGTDPALVSVIIPALDEEAALPACLEALARQARPLQVIVVDGGSRDRTRELAAARGARVLCGARGRAQQMNLGARFADGQVLLFLHADTRLPADGLARVREAASAGVSAGAFTMRFDRDGWSYRLVEWLADRYASLTGDLYGDRAIFVERALFERLGGYRELRIMEDLELAARLRRAGVRARLLAGPIITSARRVEAAGWPRLIWASLRLIWAFHRGRPLADDAVRLFSVGKRGEREALP